MVLASVRLLLCLCAYNACMGATHPFGDELALVQMSAAGSSPQVPLLKRAAHVVDDGIVPTAYKTKVQANARADIHSERYQAVRELILHIPELAHSSHIVDYLSSLDAAPSLLDQTGCLYLPSEATWAAFYDYVEHPYAPLFATMIANAFHPNCENRSLSGSSIQFCEGGRGIRGMSASSAECLPVAQVGETPHGIKVFQVDGFVGMPAQWSVHVDRVDRKGPGRARRSLAGRRQDMCHATEDQPLPPVPQNQRLVVPMQFVVCYALSRSRERVSEEMLREQAKWMNAGFSGKSPFNRMDFDDSMPPQADMQIDFVLQGIEYVQDANCARYSFSEMGYAGRYNRYTGKALTVVFVADDDSGILGMSNFPTDTAEESPELVTIINVVGLRHYGGANRDIIYDFTYDEGDTVTHESGHGLGLFHTFQNGCSGAGDSVPDTNHEAFAHYTCARSTSCGGVLPDPVHNFMDYSPDACMMGFTEMQKRRVWCVMQNYRPRLYRLSLKEVNASSVGVPDGEEDEDENKEMAEEVSRRAK